MDKLYLYLETYPTEKVKVWAVTAKTVTDCVNRGQIPRIRLPEEVASKIDPHAPKIAILLGQDKHPDREEKDYSIFPDYVDAIINSGGFPVFIAFDKVEEQLKQEKPDGILLVGGNFRLEKQKKDEYEKRPLAYIKLLEYAQANKLPVFAICGGEQMLAISYDATAVYWLEEHLQKPYVCSHKIKLEETSKLRQIIGRDEMEINSCHHTAIEFDEENPFLRNVGWAEDGVIEAIELKDSWNEFVIGVQWHPERLMKIGDEDSTKLFKAFIKASKS